MVDGAQFVMMVLDIMMQGWPANSWDTAPTIIMGM